MPAFQPFVCIIYLLMYKGGEIPSMRVVDSYHHFRKYLYTRSWLGHRAVGLFKDRFLHLLLKIGFPNKRVWDLSRCFGGATRRSVSTQVWIHTALVAVCGWASEGRSRWESCLSGSDLGHCFVCGYTSSSRMPMRGGGHQLWFIASPIIFNLNPGLWHIILLNPCYKNSKYIRHNIKQTWQYEVTLHQSLLGLK